MLYKLWNSVCHRWRKFSVIIILITVLAPRVCNSDKHNNNNGGDVREQELIVPPYKEYYMEHSISAKEAKATYQKMRNQLLSEPNDPWCISVSCTKQVKKYCLGNEMLHDHCCCDSRHGKEQLPWLPHECYVGNNNCRPHAGSCMQYSEWKQCCCDKMVADEWKHILSSSTQRMPFKYLQIILVLLLYDLTM